MLGGKGRRALIAERLIDHGKQIFRRVVAGPYVDELVPDFGGKAVFIRIVQHPTLREDLIGAAERLSRTDKGGAIRHPRRLLSGKLT